MLITKFQHPVSKTEEIIMIFKFIVMIILFIIVGLLVEKILHPSFSLSETTYKLKEDIRTVIKCFFEEKREEKVARHIFSPRLSDELKKVVSPYSNTAFDIGTVNTIHSGTPYIGIHFVPKEKMDMEKLNEVTRLTLLKFRHYLRSYQLSWRTFACFSSGQDYVNIFIYYEELPEDSECFNYRYKMTIIETSTPDYGILQDDELNKELANVDKNRI